MVTEPQDWQSTWEKEYDGGGRRGWDKFDVLFAGLIVTDLLGWTLLLFATMEDTAAATMLLLLAGIVGLLVLFWRLA